MTMLNTKYKQLLLSGAALSVLTACVPTTPQWDAQFGQSVRLIQQQQIIDPTAHGDAPVNGIDGASGREAIVRYRSSFKEPVPASSSFTIGVSR